MSQLYVILREKFCISLSAEIRRLILATGEIVESTDLLEKGDRVWVELKILSNLTNPQHKAGCPFDQK